jgi:hypothetical protein
MSQTWTDDVYSSGANYGTSMTNMENNFATLKSNFSGLTAPSSPPTGQLWYNTTKKLLCVATSDATNKWRPLFHGTIATKFWIYTNTALDGWVIDSSVTDKVIAIKGGSYGDTGGTIGGTWLYSSHTLTVAEMPSHSHSSQTFGSGGMWFYEPEDYTEAYAYGLYTGYTGGDQSHDHGSSWRPYAAVGTLQRPNL